MSKVLIVLGMHRSGTSLFSSWLHKCNLNLGDRLLGNNFSNEKGHYEDLDFLNLHEETLSANNIIPTGLFPPFEFTLNDYYFNKLKSNVIFKNLLHKQWGWKEPRTCLFLEYYPKFQPKAKYIIVYRDYNFVVDSLIRRDIKSLELWFANFTESEKEANFEHLMAEKAKLHELKDIYLTTWIAYNQKILNFVSTLNDNVFAVTHYNNLLQNDKLIFKTLKKWRFKLNYHPFSTVFDTNLFNEIEPQISFDPDLELKAKEIKTQMTNLLEKNYTT